MDQPQPQTDLTPDSEKKPYAPPRLTVYGLVQDITAGKGGQTTDGEASFVNPP